jgi:Ca2+-binding EF-hand superfamily protein
MDPITCKTKGENQNHLKLKEDQTNQAIVYFWGRINEKFDKIVKAFRYFDVHSRGILTFNDFKFCIEKLAIKLTDDEIKNIFAYIDRVINSKL